MTVIMFTALYCINMTSMAWKVIVCAFVTCSVVIYCKIYQSLEYKMCDCKTEVGLELRKEISISRDPVVYVITPTYHRSTQQPDLTRLAQTLMHISGLHWIVVEDSLQPTKFVTELIKRSGINHTRLTVPTPANETKVK